MTPFEHTRERTWDGGKPLLQSTRSSLPNPDMSALRRLRFGFRDRVGDLEASVPTGAVRPFKEGVPPLLSPGHGHDLPKHIEARHRSSAV